MEVHYVLEEGGETFIIKIIKIWPFGRGPKLESLAITEHRGLVCPVAFCRCVLKFSVIDSAG